MNPQLPTIIARLDTLFPNPKTELIYENEFQLLVAIILSAQTTDKQVNSVTATFFRYFQSPKDLVAMGEEKIRQHISRIGLYNSKAKNIFRTAQMLESEYDSRIPETLKELQKLPGVGVKTAKVWLSIVKNMPYLAVDTHVHRVLNRLEIVRTKTPLQTNSQAEKIIKKADAARLHHTLILFGRYYCTARNPKCQNCVLRDICPYPEKNV